MMRFQLERSGRFGGESLRVLKISALILALICERTPLSSKVSFKTSFNSLMLAIQFKFWNQQIKVIYLMQSFSKSNASNLHKQASQTLIRSRNSSFLHPISSPKNTVQLNSLLTGEVPSTLQTTGYRETTSINRLVSGNNMRSKRPILLDIQQRIFGEVLALMDQIDQLRSNIVSIRDEIQSLQIQHPNIEQQVKYHGYSQRLTQQQCIDLQEENIELIKQIEQIESKEANSLEQVLKMQKQKYQELKGQLSDSSSSRNIQERVKQLKKSIAELQNMRSSKVHSSFPQFDQLKRQNQQLRNKTVVYLKNGRISEEQQQLMDYLKSEETSRIQFMEELKVFKGEYIRLKKQNEILRERIRKGYSHDAKQNSNIQNQSKMTNKSSLAIESNLSRPKQSDKLSQYESHIRLMQYASN